MSQLHFIQVFTFFFKVIRLILFDVRTKSTTKIMENLCSKHVVSHSKRDEIVFNDFNSANRS